ncbi:aerolysin family beta-barrel pore-forming toxin [Bacterioplanes sanyensis]|uniref:Aerolysin family beta-barrel pore-forming toxin n=1 Tax=Bacterioplanes sanyensis TaxID=1249553 RepID=A0A222FIG0_9GAMM|nr:aerolysin family beta-barrel pore-forming toxin [Bacterioplanes sanyensis]ASP38825.1 aerolysin family beta-barrel pore-forming toxin [Bacterioplanes sanyensis]
MIRYASQSAVLLTALMSPVVAASPADDIADFGDKLYAQQDAASLKYSIISDPDFHKPLAYMAHFMGYAWCGGTGSSYVGDDFHISQINQNQYRLQARYDANDANAGGYRANERLKMDISNIRFITNPGELELGEPQVYDREPIKTVTYVVRNEGDTDDTKVATLSYNETESWSKQDNFSFSETIGITNSYEFGLKLFGGKTEIKAEFSADQGWSETEGNSDTVSQSAQYRAIVPARSKREITITFFKQKADIPYQSKMHMDYHVTYENFLRWGGNARHDHPTDRPWEKYTFGGRNQLNAAEDMLDQYLHRHIPGYSHWDWQWMLNEHGKDSLRWALGASSKQRFVVPMSGKFTTVDASQYNITAGPAIPLTAEELSASQNQRTKRSVSSKVGGNTLVKASEQDFDWEQRISDVRFTLENRLQQ